jgi:glycerol-3-phosphate O-acyltransferase / dihydroxyacetone phosphate acyltransferase
VRRGFEAFFRSILHIFFRRIEVVGEELLPRSGPTVVVLNHPNALVDPGLVLCFSPRPVSFLAKSTLFKMPVVSFLVKAFDSVPVYRREDAADPAKNRETFETARRILFGGGVLALFPEGISHSEPNLQPLKTGAARIALGAASLAGEPVTIVPAGLFFTDKSRFRSDALLVYGEPLQAEPVELDDAQEPSRADARALTDRLAQALETVTLLADGVDALTLVARAQKLYEGGDADSLHDAFELRQRLLDGYLALRERDPGTLASLLEDMESIESDCRSLGLDPKHLNPEDFGAGRVLAYTVRAVVGLSLLLPLAVLGFVLNYPPYRLVGVLSVRYAREEDDMIATGKVLGSMLFFPLFWMIVAGAAWALLGPWAAGGALALSPVTGLAGLVFSERFGGAMAALRGLMIVTRRREAYNDVVARQAAVRERINTLGAELEV